MFFKTLNTDIYRCSMAIFIITCLSSTRQIIHPPPPFAPPQNEVLTVEITKRLLMGQVSGNALEQHRWNKLLFNSFKF
jgi:hypothetical protein